MKRIYSSLSPQSPQNRRWISYYPACTLHSSCIHQTNDIRGPYFYLLNGKIHSLQATRWVAFITASEGRVAPLLATCQEAPISTDGVAVTSCLVFGKCRVQIFVLMLGISNKCLWALSPSPEFLGAIAKSMPSLGHNSFFPHLSNSSFINYSIIWRQLFSVTENFMK